MSLRYLIVVVCACGAPAKPEVVSPPAAPPDAGVSYELPAVETLPRWHLACEGDATVPAARSLVYLFSAMPLQPVRRGPRNADRPHTGKPRSWLQLDEAMQRAEGALARCWKWAAARGTPEVTLDLAFTMTPFGKTIAHVVTSSNGKSPELAACVEENIAHLEIADLSPRTTRMRAKVAFVRVAQGKWPTPPKRPTGLTAPEPRTKRCVPVLDDASTDQLTSPIEYTVDDFDEARIVRSPNEVPTVRIGCHRSGHLHTSKASIRTAIESNLGALQTCYADARDRDPALAGRVDVVFVLADVTSPTKIAISGAGDRAFHDCLTAAVGDLWLADSIPEANIEVRVPFTLEAAASAPARSLDLEAALANHVRAVATAPDPRARCFAHAAAVQTLAQLAPWLDDPRVLAATKALTTHAATLTEADALACLAPIEQVLGKIAYGGQSLSPAALRWSWVDRIEAVLPIAHRLAWGAQLRWFHAASLALTTGRHAEGVAALRQLAGTESDELVRGLAEAELARYELPKHVEKRHCEKLR